MKKTETIFDFNHIDNNIDKNHFITKKSGPIGELTNISNN